MLNRILFQRIVLVLIVLAAIGLFTVVAFRYQTTNVPTLVTAISKGDSVTAANLRIIPYPANALVNFAGLITNSSDLEGKVAAVSINAGVPLTANLFGVSNAKDPRYPTATDLDQFNIKYYIPTDIKSSQGGVIRPGDYVDVIYQDVGVQTATFVLQKVHVVGARTAAGDNTEGNGTSTTGSEGGLLGVGGSSRATFGIAGYLLSVTPTQALLLAPLNPANIRLVQVDPESPNLPGISSGIGTTPTVSPAP